MINNVTIYRYRRTVYETSTYSSARQSFTLYLRGTQTCWRFLFPTRIYTFVKRRILLIIKMTTNNSSIVTDIMNMSADSIVTDMSADSDCTFYFNNTDSGLAEHFYKDYNRRIITIVIPIVVALGLLGNISFLFVICRLKCMRNMTNFYLANLAIADVCVLSAASIQYFWSYSYSAPLDISLIGYTFKTPFGCSLPNVLNYSCYFASIWFITLVAMERYLAICHPLKHIMIRGKGRAIRLVAMAWLLSFSMGVFSAPYAGIEVVCLYGPSGGPFGDMPRKISRCTALCPACEVILWLIDTTQFFIALACNSFMYWRIIYTLNKVVTGSNQLSQESTRTRNQENRDNVARMLSINALVFSSVCHRSWS